MENRQLTKRQYRASSLSTRRQRHACNVIKIYRLTLLAKELGRNGDDGAQCDQMTNLFLKIWP